MPQSTPPDPRDAQLAAKAEQAQQAAREAAHWLRGEVGRVVDNYKGQSKYFKWRSWIVAAYVAISATSIVMAMPTLNTISAYVVPTTDFRGRLILSVENQSGEPWTGLRLVLDDTWVFEKEQVPPGEKVMPNVTQFARRIGARTPAPENLRPRLLRVETDQGEYETKLFAEE